MTELVPFQEPVPLEVQRLREEDAERVLKYLAPDLSINTRRSYESHLRNFTKWCDKRQWPPVPTTEARVIAYLTWLCNRPDEEGGRVRPSSVKAIKSAIGMMHEQAGYPNPVQGKPLKNALKALDREFQGGRRRQVDPLLVDDVQAAAAVRDPESLEELRDAAIIWVAYGGLLRRSEVVALDVDDVERYRRRLDDGTLVTRTRVHIRQSKTDQTGEGAEVDIPTPAADAVRAWLTAAGITSGPIFRPFNRGKLLNRRLSAQYVAIVIKKRTELAELEGTYSGHSGRRGGATEAKANKVSDTELQRVGRWKSANAMQLYITGVADTDADIRAGVKRSAEEAP
jgi:integrase